MNEETLSKIKAADNLSRRTGRSTQIADAAIQTLFKKGEVVVRDHFPDVKADRYLFDRVLRRLRAEHSGTSIDINSANFTISLRQ